MHALNTAHVFQVFRFEIPVANLPRMAKLCVGVFEKKKNNTQHPLFWVNAYVFDYRCVATELVNFDTQLWLRCPAHQ